MAKFKAPTGAKKKSGVGATRDPQSARELDERAQALTAEGRFQEAVIFGKLAVQRDPTEARLWSNLGCALSHVDAVAAAEAFREALARVRAQTTPFDAEDATLLSVIGTGAAPVAPEEAIALLEKAALLDRANPLAVENWAGALLGAGRCEEAVTWFKRAARLAPDSADVASGYGSALWQLDQLRKAEAEMRRALSLDPAHDVARHNLAVLLLDDGRADEAVSRFLDALTRDPDDPILNGFVGLSLARAGRRDEAAVYRDIAAEAAEKIMRLVRETDEEAPRPVRRRARN